MRKLTLVVFLLVTAYPFGLRAQLPAAIEEKVQSLRATIAKREASTCVTQSISCGQTIHGSLDPGDCSLGSGSVADLFAFNGTSGESVTGTLSSSAFDPFLDLLDPTPNNAAFNGGVGSTQVSFTLDQTGVWTWGVTNLDGLFELGNYTLTLQCSGATANCIPNDTTLCLNNGRFKVSGTYDAGHGNAGTAHVVDLTSDTGYLWFFADSNVEAVVKVLNGCGL